MSPGEVSNFLDSLRCLISELESVKIPTVGVVDGYALGGGTEIALGCDLRVGGVSLSLPSFALQSS
jgi:methylglutaconyl-CoA hydratase